MLVEGPAPEVFSRAASTYRQLDPDTRALVWPAVMAGKISFKQLADWSAEEAKRELENGDDDDEEDDELEIHHINVGQADSTLIITPEGETILIDTGDWPQEGEEVINYLEDLEIDRIDHLVATHGHADHIGGHAEVIEHFETKHDGVGLAYDSGIVVDSDSYQEYRDAIDDYDITLVEVQEGDSLLIQDEEVETTVLNPTSDSANDEVHYNSIVMTIEYNGFQYLTTGDIEKDAEERIVSQWNAKLDAEIYHAGHHGSSTSSTDEFLDEVDPEIAIVSSALDSEYGHPDDIVLERFSERAIETYWTGVHNDVIVETDGLEIKITPGRKFSTDPDDLREAKPDE